MNDILIALEEINYWKKAPDFKLGHFREQYVNAIRKSLGNKLIKVLIGQRRTGKSYIIRQLMHRLIQKEKVKKTNIFYLNKELFEFEKIKKAEDLADIIVQYEKAWQPEGKIYVFIDEVQNIDQWEKIVVSLAQHPVKDYEIIITGSNSKLLSGELATMIAGRYMVKDIYPFSYREFLNINKQENNKENFIKYIQSSGLPEIFNLHDHDSVIHYFHALKNTILLKDIMYRHKIRDYVLLEDIFLYLIHNIGNMTSIPSILKYFKSKNRKADYTTVAQYISYMEEAFIIHQAPRMLIKSKELLSGEKKYFINDLGFRNYLYPSLTKDFGAILENIVFMHLKMSGQKIKIGTGKQFEVDFFTEKENKKIYLQVAYVMPNEDTIKREFGALEKINDNLPKYVVSMDDFIHQNENGIVHQFVWDLVYELG